MIIQLIYSIYTIVQRGVSLTRPQKVGADRIPWCCHICLSIEYRSRNRHRNLWVGQYVSSWWCQVLFRYLHQIYDYILYVIKCLTGMAWGSLHFTDTCCPVLDVRNNWHTANLSHYCVCNNTTSIIFLSSDLLWEHRNEPVAMEFPYSVFTSQLEYSAIFRFVTGCLAVFRVVDCHFLPLYVGTFLADLF